MDIKILSEQGNKATVVCGCGKVRTVFKCNIYKMRKQSFCRCKKEGEKFVEKVPHLVIKHHINSTQSLQQMGFKQVRFKTAEPRKTEYYLSVCKDGRLVFEGCEGVIGNFADVWADPQNRRVALQSSATGDVKFRKNFVINRKEFAWAKENGVVKVKGRYIPNVNAVVFQL